MNKMVEIPTLPAIKQSGDSATVRPIEMRKPTAYQVYWSRFQGALLNEFIMTLNFRTMGQEDEWCPQNCWKLQHRSHRCLFIYLCIRYLPLMSFRNIFSCSSQIHMTVVTLYMIVIHIETGRCDSTRRSIKTSDPAFLRALKSPASWFKVA